MTAEPAAHVYNLNSKKMYNTEFNKTHVPSAYTYIVYHSLIQNTSATLHR